MNKYDIIIVGAGPAGATAALYANRSNLKCLLIDKSFFPRDKVCGDALSGKSVRIMRELGLVDEVEQLNGSLINRITFGSPSHKQFDINLKGSSDPAHIKQGFVIPREIFDNYLFEKAKSVTDTKEGFTVTDLVYDKGILSGIKGINNNKEEEEFKAPIIMGCDGANSIVSRKLKLYEMDMKNTAVAIRCYYKGVKGLTDQIELHYVEEVLPGYFWLFPAGDGIANIGIGLSKNDAKKEKRNLKQILNDVISSEYFKSRFSDAKPLEKPVGWNLPLGRIKRKSYGDGFMLLGDAAGLIDPFTGEGIGNAMVSAKYAIQVASQAKKMNNYSKSFLSEYDKLLWSEVGKELKTSTKLQGLARSKFLLNFVINRAARNKEVQDIISGMLTNEIPKDKLSNPMFYFKILFS